MHCDTLLAYLAGAMDADGHITIQRTMRTVGKRYAHSPIYYFPKMGYTSVSEGVPNLLRSTFGGAVHRYQPTKAAHHKLVHIWYIGTAECREAALLLVPHLRQKRRQAELVAELCAVITAQHAEQMATQKPPYRITPEHLSIRERYWAEVTELNQPTNRRSHFVGKSRASLILERISPMVLPARAPATIDQVDP